MPDLEDQLRTYYEATTAPVDVGDVLVEEGTVLIGPFPEASVRRSMGERDWWRGPIGAVAGVLAVIVVGVVAFLAFQGDAEDVADSTTTSLGAAEEFTSEDALAMVEEYFAAFERGELDAVMMTLTADAEIDLGSTQSISQLHRLTAWDIGQRTERRSVDCASAGESETGAQVVACSYDDVQYITALVGSEPTTWRLRFQVTETGIGSIVGALDAWNYDPTNREFDRWMRLVHPDDAGATNCCGGPTVEGSLADGRLRAQYAELWASYLDETACSYATPCELTTPGLSRRVLESFGVLFNAGETDRILSLLAPDANVINGIHILERELAWNSAAGTRLVRWACQLQEPQPAPLVPATCTGAYEPPFRDSAGLAPIETEFRFEVTLEGIVHMDEDAQWALPPPIEQQLYNEWVAAYPGQPDIGIGAASVEDAIAQGSLARQLAEEYAAFLEENGCTYDEPCEP